MVAAGGTLDRAEVRTAFRILVASGRNPDRSRAQRLECLGSHEVHLDPEIAVVDSGTDSGVDLHIQTAAVVCMEVVARGTGSGSEVAEAVVVVGFAELDALTV